MFSHVNVKVALLGNRDIFLVKTNNMNKFIDRQCSIRQNNLKRTFLITESSQCRRFENFRLPLLYLRTNHHLAQFAYDRIHSWRRITNQGRMCQPQRQQCRLFHGTYSGICQANYNIILRYIVVNYIYYFNSLGKSLISNVIINIYKNCSETKKKYFEIFVLSNTKSPTNYKIGMKWS